jgi:hypothetical protein
MYTTVTASIPDDVGRDSVPKYQTPAPRIRSSSVEKTRLEVTLKFFIL